MKIPNDNADPLIKRIRSFINKNFSSNVAYAKAAGVQESAVRRLFYSNPDPRLSSIRRMESIIPDDYAPDGEDV